MSHVRSPRTTKPSRRSFLVATGATALSAIPATATTPLGPDRPPNILFVLADDLGYADLSVYGRRDYQTPTIDRLAAQGLMLSQAYSSSPVCSPTRVALITGRYPQRLAVGLPEPIRSAKLDPVGLPPRMGLLPKLMKSAGYATSLVGKWHMGWPPEHGPIACGYDRFFGIVGAGADYVSHREHNLVEPDRPGLYEGDQIVQRTGYLTDLLAERAIEDMRTAAGSRMPFFVSLHFNAPHWPWQGPADRALPKGTDLFQRDGGSLATYAEMVRAMDAAVGRVLGEVDRLGAADQTLVILTSDNGGERFADTWPLRGQKRELLEGGIRVPGILRWPGRIAPGTRSNQVATSMDWLPTLASAARAPLDAEFPPDGEDLLSVLTGKAPVRQRKLFWRFAQRGQAAVRDGDWKYLRIDNEEQLFHVATDPRERVNLRRREAAMFERLKADWGTWNTDMLAPPSGS